MRVKVLLFARLRREAGRDALDLELPEGATVRDAAREVEARLGTSLRGCMAAVNEGYATPETALGAGDEVAFLPPVAGGSGAGESSTEDHLEVTADPLDLLAAQTFLVRPGFGAQAYFVGTVRSPNAGMDVAYLEYEAYPPLALAVMRDAAARARAEHGAGAVYLAHRTGRVVPAEPSILVGVGSAHRRAALEACDFLIEHLKKHLPVWKLEVGENGERWVEGTTGAPTL